MSWNSVLMVKVFKRRKKLGAVFYSKKIPTCFVLSMGHEIFCLVVLFAIFHLTVKKSLSMRASMRAFVLASVRPSFSFLLVTLLSFTQIVFGGRLY